MLYLQFVLGCLDVVSALEDVDAEATAKKKKKAS